MSEELDTPLNQTEDEVKSQPSLLDKAKQFYNENKKLCIILAIAFAIVIIVIVVVIIVLCHKKKSKSTFVESDLSNTEAFHQLNAKEGDEKFEFTNSWIESIIGSK